MKKTILLNLVVLLVTAAFASAAIHVVPGEYPTIQDALAAASSGDEIWVAEGIYKPDQGGGNTPGDRNATFQLKNGVALYGGFPVGGGEWDDRDPNVYQTILSGDLNGDDLGGFYDPSRDENSYHVVTGSGTDETAVLDGFIISGGKANGLQPHVNGGGMFNNSGSPTITNCTFIGNHAGDCGGGLYNWNGSNPSVSNCTFSGNLSYNGNGMYNYSSNPTVADSLFTENLGGNGGAGMYNRDSNPTVTNCIFSGNQSWDGAGMHNSASSPMLTNCTFSDNSAGDDGGGMINRKDSISSNPTLINCIFSGNSADDDGGGLYNYRSSPTMANCIVSDNCANYVGGIYFRGGSPTISNCIISGNVSDNGTGGIHSHGYNSLTISNCIISGNSGEYAGGIMCSDSSSAVITNCVIADNVAEFYPGGIWIHNRTTATITNCILWGNICMVDEVAQIYVWTGVDAATAHVTYCDVQGGYNEYQGVSTWENNIDTDPRFVSTGDYHILANSPCINAGDPEFVAEPDETDIDGESRIFAGRVDIGADEYAGYLNPIADAGPDQYVGEPQLITLDGSGSFFYDPDGVTEYQWTQTAGAKVKLSDATAMQPTFRAKFEGEYRFELVVSDGVNTSQADEVLIFVGNQLPVADAGSNIICWVPEQVTLDGSGSYDPDAGDELTYTWAQVAGPEVILEGANTPSPYFDCIEEGLYEFELVVNDGLADSEPSTTQVVTIDVAINQQDLNLSGIGTYAHYGDVSANWVVYGVGCCCDVTWAPKCKNLQTGQIHSFGGALIQPKIDGDILVWFTYGDGFGTPWFHEPSNCSVFVRNLATGAQKTLRRWTWSKSYGYPVVSGKKVVWLEHLGLDPNPKGSGEANNWWNTPYNICGADVTDLYKPVYFTIAEDVGSHDPYPCHSYASDFDDVLDISGNIVVWEGDGDIYGADISDLNDIRVFTICSDPARQFDPAISGDMVVWTDERNDGGDIYGADISDMENIEVFEIVKKDGTQQQPAIDDRMMVYIDGSHYGEIKACFLVRQGEQSGWLEISLAEAQYGLGPAIDGKTIIWQSDYYGVARGISLDVCYSTVDGPIENLTTGKRYDYIRHAVYLAADGDEIVVPEGVYYENINFKGENIILRSTDPNDPAVVASTVINGGSDVVTFSSGEDASCVLTGFTITGGGKGIHCSGASPTISNCVITENTGTGCYSWNSDITVTNCTIAGNGAEGIYSFSFKGNDIAITNSSITGNGAEGIYFDNSDSTIINCTIAENAGTGFYCRAGNVVITDCTITTNTGIGIDLGEGSDATIGNCTISENTGTGLYCYDSYLTATDCTIDKNGGAGIESWDGSNRAITNCTVVGNGAGGIYCDNTDSMIDNCTIAENGAEGIYSDSSPSTISNCAIAGNGSAGIDSRRMSASTISNCAIVGNSGVGIKSGILSGPVIINCTIAENADVGVFCYLNLATTITNCIIWNNWPEQIVEDNAPTSVTYSNVQGGWPGEGNISEDPLFVDADGADNVVGTEDDNLRLLGGSPCIDAGTDAGVYEDIEGNIRPYDYPDVDNNGDLDEFDMGAYEALVPPLEVPMKFTPQALNPGSQGNWVKAHFVLPEEFGVEDVDVSTPASLEPLGIESDHINVFINEDGLVEIEIAFDRADFCGAVGDYGPAEVTVIGRLVSGQNFYGTDTIRIITKNLEYLAVFASYWLDVDCGVPDWCSGVDLDQDSVVDFVDFALFDGCCIEVIKE